jgi:hypothetical protein
VLEHLARSLPANHLNLELIYHNLGLLYRSEGDNVEAEEYFSLVN